MATIGASKADVRAAFNQSSVNFTFEDSPLNDGTPRLIGKSADSLMIVELYGAGNDLTKATFTTFLGQGIPKGQADLLGDYNVTFLSETAPGYEWDSSLAESFEGLVFSGSNEKRIGAGDNIVSVRLEKKSGVYALYLLVEPEQA